MGNPIMRCSVCGAKCPLNWSGKCVEHRAQPCQYEGCVQRFMPNSKQAGRKYCEKHRWIETKGNRDDYLARKESAAVGIYNRASLSAAWKGESV